MSSLAVLFGVLSPVSTTIAARAASVSGSLIIAPPSMCLVMTPSNVDEVRAIPAGTVLSQFCTSGGVRNPAPFSPSRGDTIELTNSVVSIVVGLHDIAKADCGAAQTAVVTISRQ